MAYTLIIVQNIESGIWKKRPGGDAFRVLFKFLRREWDQRLAGFSEFLHIETRVVTSV